MIENELQARLSCIYNIVCELRRRDGNSAELDDIACAAMYFEPTRFTRERSFKSTIARIEGAKRWSPSMIFDESVDPELLKQRIADLEQTRVGAEAHIAELETELRETKDEAARYRALWEETT